MREDELADLLRQARPRVTTSSEDEARLLAMATLETGPERARLRRRRDRPPTPRRGRGHLLPVGIATGLLLAGAGTLTAHQLSVPPFMTLENGLERTREGAPLEFRTDQGTLVSCLAFLEFRDLSAAQEEQVNAVITEGDWEGYGQRLYDGLSSEQRAVQEGPGPVGYEAMRDLERRALAATPGTGLRQPHGPAITGGAISCEYPEGPPTHEQ